MTPTPSPGGRLASHFKQQPSVVDAPRAHVADTPEKTAFRFHTGPVTLDVAWSFAQLDRRARALAAQLQARARPGERVLILQPPGLEYVATFLGCQYAGMVAVPVYPRGAARLGRSLSRLMRVVADSEAVVVATTGQVQAEAAALLGGAAAPPLQWLATDDIPDESADAYRPRRSAPHEVSLSSGGPWLSRWSPTSTAPWPRFRLSGFAAAGGAARRRLHTAAASRLGGARRACCRASRRCGGGTGLVPPHVRCAGAAAGAHLIPPQMRLVIIGGEAVSAARLDGWRAAVGPRVRPLNTYRPTEATVVATCAEMSGDGGELPGDPGIAIGRPLPGVLAAVLSPHGQPVLAGDVVELNLAGRGLADGYLRRPRLQAARFVDLPAWAGGGRAYRTGDMVRRIADGQLVFVGRRDDEVKISGYRVDPAEVEPF